MIKFGLGFYAGIVVANAIVSIVASDDDAWKTWTDRMDKQHGRSMDISITGTPTLDDLEQGLRNAFMARGSKA